MDAVPDRITREEFLRVMQLHIGAENGASVRQIVQEIRLDLVPVPGAERQVRKIVEELRREGEHICAHPTRGYFMARTAKELEETCEYLTHRAMTTLTQVSGMKRVSVPDLVGQMRLES